MSRRREIRCSNARIALKFSRRSAAETPAKFHSHGPLTRYVKLRVVHAPGTPGTFSPAADFKGNRKLAIPACITARASRTCRDACRDRLPAVAEKTFSAIPAHAHPQFYVSDKRPIGTLWPPISCLRDFPGSYGKMSYAILNRPLYSFSPEPVTEVDEGWR